MVMPTIGARQASHRGLARRRPKSRGRRPMSVRVRPPAPSCPSRFLESPVERLTKQSDTVTKSQGRSLSVENPNVHDPPNTGPAECVGRTSPGSLLASNTFRARLHGARPRVHGAPRYRSLGGRGSLHLDCEKPLGGPRFHHVRWRTIGAVASPVPHRPGVSRMSWPRPCGGGAPPERGRL